MIESIVNTSVIGCKLSAPFTATRYRFGAIVITIVSIEPTSYFQIEELRSSAHLSLSSGENFQGAKLFSVLLNMLFHSAGALLSSIIKYRRSCTMISKGLIATGHSCTHAWQVVQARNSSSVI